MEKKIGDIYRHFKGVAEKISGVEMIISLEHGSSQEHFRCATCFDLDDCLESQGFWPGRKTDGEVIHTSEGSWQRQLHVLNLRQ